MRKLKIGTSSFGCDQGKSGIGRYFQRVLLELEKEADKRGHEIELLTHKAEKEIFLVAESRITARYVPNLFRWPLANVGWNFLLLPLICARQGYDVFFLPAANRRLPFYSPCPLVGTVHDFSALHVSEKYDPLRMFYIKKILPLLFRNLDVVLSVSESTKKDLLSYGGVRSERIVLTPNAVDAEQFVRPTEDFCQNVLQQKFGIFKPFILYVSRVEHPGKNHWKLIEAYRLLKAKHNIIEDLVFAGPLKERANEVVNFAAAGSYAENIHFTDYLGDEELCCFYAAARIMVFPSFFEGFGLPLLEAMVFGLPVTCADSSSLPEVASDAALYFNPHDHRDMAEKILRLLKDENLQNQLRERGYQRVAAFSWRESAIKIMGAIEKICT